MSTSWSSNTSNLVLPYLAVGQAQKHVTVNESLRRLDALVQLTVVSASETSQPASPADGAVYIVPPGKSGADWSAYANWSLGYYRDGAWEELSPREGWLAHVKDADRLLRYTGAAWAAFAANELVDVSASGRVLGRISSGAGAAEEIAFTDQAQALCDDTSFQAMCATLGTWRVLAAGAVAVSHTGDTAEFALATIAIPGGSMGPNGVMRVRLLFSYTNSANAKTLRMRLGGPSGTAFLNVGVTTTAAYATEKDIQNRNAQDSQIGAPANSSSASANTSAGVVTAAVDTSVNQDLVITGQLADAGETVTLRSYIVEVAYRA